MKILLSYLFFFFLSCELFASITPKQLITNGKFNGNIYISENCAIEELRLAHEIADWIARVTGSEKPLVKQENFLGQDEVQIFIGKTVASENAGIKPPKSEGESYTIAPKGNQIYILGNSEIATYHAGARFLNREFGIEFIFPGVEGAEWKPLKNVPFPKEVENYVPVWTWRSATIYGHGDWWLKLGFGKLPMFSHNLHRIFTPEIYAQHPELAPMIMNKRENKRAGGYAPQPNLANPLAAKIASEAAEKYFGDAPQESCFAVGINDCTSWDESPESEAVFRELRYYRNLPNRSDYFYDFVNKVAQNLQKNPQLSNKRIGAIAYLDVQDAPSFKLEKNVLPVLCVDRSNWVFPQFKEEDKKLMQKWEKSGADYWGIYDYYYGLPFLFPRQFFSVQAESIKYAYDHGARLFFAEINPIIPFDAPKIWLTSKLLQNPKANPNEILEHFFELAYGNAKEQMKKFFKQCEEIWKNQGGQCRWIKGYGAENSFEIFPPKQCEELKKILLEARELFPKETDDARTLRIVARIDATIDNFERTEMMSKNYFARKQLQIAELNDANDLINFFKNPAWRAKEQEQHQEWEEKGLPKVSGKHKVSPKETRFEALVRAIKTLREIPKSEQRKHAEESLELLMKSKGDDSDSKFLAKLREIIPQLQAKPSFTEDFEPIKFRDPNHGEWQEKSRFYPLEKTGWRQGKKLDIPSAWNPIFAASEKVKSEESPNAKTGKSALKISGECELAQFSRIFKVKPGQKFFASIWCRGKVDCGNTTFFSFLWKDVNKIDVSAPEMTLMPVDENKKWRQLMLYGEAPENAEFLEIAIGTSYQGPDDEAIFDDFSLYLY